MGCDEVDRTWQYGRGEGERGIVDGFDAYLEDVKVSSLGEWAGDFRMSSGHLEVVHC